MKRSCGILMPVFSLPGKYGIGTFGKESYDFIDFLSEAGQSVWQTLPLGQTVFGDSPYQTTADRSLNPYFCDLDDLYNRGLLTKAELDKATYGGNKINYGKLYKTRYALLRKAFSRFDFSDDYLSAVNKKTYDGYAVFMSLKSVYGDLSHFPEEFKRRDKKAIAEFKENNEEEYLFNVFVQYILNEQFCAMKNYAAEKGIKLMGDLPLYVACDSADLWLAPENFLLDEDMVPTEVAGVPPDYFSEDGQLWGNPLYDYEKMSEDGFAWWKKRLRFALRRYDLLRIDHFRGLDKFWAIPNGESAKAGTWRTAAGREILSPFKNRLIAEDLGVIDDGVRDLIEFTGYPGMKVLLFAFNGDPNNPYLPRNVEENSVCYVGTHDNDTAYGYAKKLSQFEFRQFRKRVNETLPQGVMKIKTKRQTARALTELAYSTKADLAVISYADVLCRDDSYRINTPSTTVGNWTVRFKPEDFTKETALYLRGLAEKYNRV